MAMTTRMMLYAFLLYGGIFAAIVAVFGKGVKNIIRSGDSYYFFKKWRRGGGGERGGIGGGPVNKKKKKNSMI